MKKGMEESGQRTDPGTDGRQEQEDAVLRGQLQQALDSVEPDGEARERMLRRIREKAAARQTADEPTPVSAPEPARRRAGFWGQLLRYGLPTAACLCILMITLWRAPGLTSGKPGDGSSREPATTPIVRFVGPSGLDAPEMCPAHWWTGRSPACTSSWTVRHTPCTPRGWREISSGWTATSWRPSR